LVWRAVRETQRNGKPVVVSMGDVAGSGGYYVAAGADAIVAEPTTLTGSIGVVFARFNLRDLMAELGIRIEYAGSDAISDAMSPARPLTEPELAQLNKTLGEVYETFKSKVAEGRKLSDEQTEEIARGRVWSGVSARQNGLVDELGGLGRAIQLAREKAGIKPDQAHELSPLPPPGLLRPLSFALSPADTSWMSALAAEAIGVPDDWAPALMRLLLRSTALLLCPIIPGPP
ncbi:MAG: S49 family peptidase, partial [Candidatus Binataceae bacterium]